jgi:ABC-type phosphate transport system substrate-binding protein
MSAFKQNMRKLGARAGVLAGASLACLAIVGVGGAAASEVASPPPHCPNALAIKGKGSSLQKFAQIEIWNKKYNTACSATGTTVSYESTGSGPGLEAFRFTGSGTEINHSYQFIGSDDAPSRTQIEHAEEVSGGAKPVVVPVSQTAIAIVAHPPTGCKFTSGTGITWKDLNKVFGGNGITEWSQFTNIEETTANACKSPVIRYVRAEGSGTTYQFKNYLQTLHTSESAEALPCTVSLPGGGTATEWSQLEVVGASEQPNKTWPQCTSSTEVKTAAGGGKLVEEVSATSGTIGYAALPDAEAHIAAANIIPLQNGEVSGSPIYRSPANTTTKNARCEEARYVVPTEARMTGSGTGIAADWSTVFGANPSIGGTEYPLCTLTYDIGWTNYTSAGYGTNATGWGKDVADYIRNYVVPTAQGQKALIGRWYSALPAGVAARNVQGAAEFSAEQLPSL